MKIELSIQELKLEAVREHSKNKYESLDDDKAKIFDVIESGELHKYFKEKNIQISAHSRKSKKG